MILMLFHLFCMIDDHWGMELRSLNYAGKSVIEIQYLRSSEDQTKHLGIIFSPDHEGGQKGSLRWGPGGPHHAQARQGGWPREHVVGPPWPTTWRALSRTLSPENPKHGRVIEEIFRHLHEAENTREKKLSRREKSAGEISSRRGEIIAIVTVSELHVIGIIVTIISTAVTVISTAPIRSRCNI